MPCSTSWRGDSTRENLHGGGHCSCCRNPIDACYDGRVSCSKQIWLSAALVSGTVIVCCTGAAWSLVGPLGQMATRDDLAQLRAEIRAEFVAGIEGDEPLLEHVRRELRASTRARQRMVDEIGRLVREADGRPR